MSHKAASARPSDLNAPKAIDEAEAEATGLLARNVPMRLIDIDAPGCLLESHQRVEDARSRVGCRWRMKSSWTMGVTVRVSRGLRVPRRGGVRADAPAGRAFDSPGHDVHASASRHQRILRQLGAFNRRGTVMRSVLARFIRNDEGQDLIEYGLLAGIITAAVVTLITTISGKVLTLFSNQNTSIR